MVNYLMPYKVSAFGLSDIGLVRQNNEDVWAQLPGELFFVLADGMGGHQAGEVAARETVEELCRLFKEKLDQSLRSFEDIQDILFGTIQEVNQTIYTLGRSDRDLKGMGTTLCCVFIHANGLIYGHVGDSRIYRLRNEELTQLTKDDSLLRELMDLGQLSERQASDFHYKNIITKAIGTEPYVEPTIHTDSLQSGDILLMCTDGLSDLLSLEDIQKIMLNHSESEMPKQLVRAAKRKGGHDNVTVVIVKIQEKDDR